MEEINLPTFVRIGKNGTALRLITETMFTGKPVYYRDGGNWYIHFRIDEKTNKIFTDDSYLTHLNNIELFEITKEEWAKDNGKYAPHSIINEMGDVKYKVSCSECGLILASSKKYIHDPIYCLACENKGDINERN